MQLTKAIPILSGTVLAQGINTAGIVLLAVFYQSSQIGILGIFNSSLIWLLNVASFKLEQGIPLQTTEREKFLLSNIGFATTILTASTVLVIAVLSHSGILPTIIKDSGLINSTYFLLLLAIAILFGGAYNIFTHLQISILNYQDIAKTIVYRSIGKNGIQVGSGLLFPKTEMLIVGEIFGQLIGISKLSKTHSRRLVTSLKKEDFQSYLLILKKNKKYPLWILPGSLLNSSITHFPVIFIGAFYGASGAGIYYLAQKAALLPAQIISKAVSKVFLGENSKSSRTRDLSAVLKSFKETNSKLLAITLPGFIFLYFATKVAHPYMPDSDWKESLEIIPVLLAGAYIKLSLSGTINFNLLSKQNLFFIWGLFRFLALISIFSTIYIFEFSLINAAISITTVQILGYLFGAALWIKAATKLIHLEARGWTKERLK